MPINKMMTHKDHIKNGNSQDIEINIFSCIVIVRKDYPHRKDD
jgi:hypothetical protein